MLRAYLLLCICALFIILIQCEFTSAQQQSTPNLKNELAEARDDQQQASMGPRGRFILMPSALSKFLLYNAKPSERQAFSSYLNQANGALSSSGFKRLDPLTGITIGKRSPSNLERQQSMEFVNWEPVFGRQHSNLHTSSRLYDFLLVPRDASISESYSAQENTQ